MTCELTGEDVGQVPSSLGHYELMVCAREELARAVDLVSELGRYTCDTCIEPGDTMDIDRYFGDATIRALLFAQIDQGQSSFEVSGEKCGLLLCIGITRDELELSRTSGSATLIRILKATGVFPYTVPGRQSALLA